MKRTSSVILISFIGSTFYSQQIMANLTDQYLSGIPTYNKLLINKNTNLLPIYIQANKVIIHYPEYIFFSGNVDIKQGNSSLIADEVQLTQHQENNKVLSRTITAIGNIIYSNNDIKLRGVRAWSDLNSKDTDVYQGNYQMIGRQGRGDASIMQQRKDNRYIVVKDGSFTSCSVGDHSWSIVGSKLIHDREEQVAKIWNARFEIGKVPVFYSPYLQIPVGDKNYSGFLIPKIKYGSNNGLEFSSSYYLSLATNYDTTIMQNYISKRGTQIKTENRYLTTLGKGLIEFDWLPKDRRFRQEHSSARNSNRWLLYWYHNWIMNQMWHFNVDYTKVSDCHYFNDLDSKYGNTTDDYVTQKFCVSYTAKNWDTSFSCKQFQIFNPYNHNTYRVIPQFTVTYYKNDVGPCDFKVFSQITRFTNINNNYPKATRLHVEPILSLPLANHWGSLNTEVKLMTTYYKQENIDAYNKNVNTRYYLKNSVIRILPQFKTDGKIVFERDVNYKPNYIQTLEPHIQYLYVLHCNQNGIGFYDSIILQTDYSSLFRDQTYSGLDFIPSTNQLVSGITTRIYNDQCVEQFNASIGQIYYFAQPNTDHLTDVWAHNHNTGTMVWAGDSCWHINNKWVVRGGLQYDAQLNNVALGNILLEYQREKKSTLQLNYRYISPQYLAQILANISYPNYQSGILQSGVSQIGLTGSWSPVNCLSLVGAYYYDTKANQSADQLVGLQYDTCCWAMNIGYERKIINWNDNNSSSQYDKKVSVNIELRGLNSNYDLDTDKILASGIIPYQSAF